MTQQPIDAIEAALLAYYGRGYGKVTDVEAYNMARAVLAALDFADKSRKVPS